MTKLTRYGMRGMGLMVLGALAHACSSPGSPAPRPGISGSGASASAAGAGGVAVSGTGASSGAGPSLSLGGSAGTAGTGPSGVGGFEACSGLELETEMIGGPLDIYLIFDRTGSMGDDCEYTLGGTPPIDSKACYATYALPDYLMNVEATNDVRLAFQLLTLSEDEEGDCDGTPYATPEIPFTQLPAVFDSPLVQRIIDEEFEDGSGTHIEGALNGLAAFTSNPANQTPGREMIGVLMTDGEPRECEEDVDTLAGIIEAHYNATGLRTFIIGMEGAENESLEAYASVGGAEPHDDFCGDGPTPCHYWNVGNGSGDAIASALQAIVAQVVPLPCQYPVASLVAPAGEDLDLGRVNMTLTDQNQVTTTIGQVPDSASCPTDTPAWYYDNAASPELMVLCPSACTQVSGAMAGARVSVVVGCEETITIK